LAGSVPGGVNLSAKALAFKASRMSPLQGFKRMFSGKALVEAAKAILKFIVIAGTTIVAVDMAMDHVPLLSRVSVTSSIPDAVTYLLYASIGVASGLLLIAVIDVPFQVAQQRKQLKMTKQEVKDENKDTEGRPEVKSRIRQVQQELSRQRMFSDLPQADVVITNPQHYAVALKYDPAEDAAPMVIAKGADLVAARIREVAKAHKVPLVRSPMLCRALYFNVEIQQFVPAPLFVAVAQILAYVQQLRLSRAGMIPVPTQPDAADLPPDYRTPGDV
jgi:flagellar biosynthetic protein FlhB